MREIGEQITAARAAAVIHETFGHLDAKPGERHKGWFVFSSSLSTVSMAIWTWCTATFQRSVKVLDISLTERTSSGT